MAFPQSDSYAAASGKPIYAGRLAPVAEVIAQQFGKYRYQSPQLFQTARSAVEPSHLPGGPDWNNDEVGPGYALVDQHGGWLWDHPGGDWIDATQTRWGSTPWFSMASGFTGEVNQEYAIQCTAALQFIQTTGRWNAFYVNTTGGLTFATPFHPTQIKPYIAVTYAGGATANLQCIIAAASDGSTSYLNTTNTEIGLPLFLEFEKPTAAVTWAVMHWVVVQHWSGASAPIKFFIVDPTINAEPVETGIAYAAELDAGLIGHPSIINFPHRYMDGEPLSNFVHSGPAYSSGNAYDPYIYQGTAGPADTSGSTYPSMGLGKIINFSASDGNSLVSSSYSGEGFEPLAPGMGALRLFMSKHIEQDPAKPEITEGFDHNGYGGSGNYGYIFMPEPLFGYLDHIFVRYYMRIGTPNGAPYRMPIAQRYQMRQDPTSDLIWADAAGKTGITAGHLCEGINSAGSGGGHGFQLRHRWRDCTADENGPDVEGWNMGIHTYDFGPNNPVGHRYGGEDQFNDSFGQKGGLGSVIYADKWYCIETELKLNTVMTDAPGFLPDGWLKVWIDGRLAMEKQNFVVRSLPLQQYVGGGVTNSPPIYNPSYVAPCRELGVNGLWLNWYHGGLTQNTVNRTQFITGLAYGTSYIGPMKFPAPSLPSWVPASGTIATIPEANSYMSIDPGQSPVGGYSYDRLGGLIENVWSKVIDDYSGSVYNPYLGAKGSIIYHGGGHAATNWNGIVAFDLATLTYSVIMPGCLDCYPINSFPLVDGSGCEYHDGQPLSAHTYDTLVILGPEAGYPKGALITVVRMAAEPYYSLGTTAAHIFDFNNPGAKFTRLAGHTMVGLPSSPGAACAYDPDLGRVWWVSNTNQPAYQTYFDLATNSHQKVSLTYETSINAPSPDSQSLRYDSARKLLILSDVQPEAAGSARRLSYFNTANPTAGWTYPTLSQPFPDAAGAIGFGFDKAPDGSYLCFVQSDPSKLYRLTIPAVLTDTWTVTPVAYTGTPLFATGSNWVIGKRWSYIPALQSFVVKQGAAHAHQIYRV